MNEVIDHITNKMGTEPVSYELVDWPDMKTPTNSLLWKLPPPTGEDKSILQLDSELTEKLYELVKDAPDSPEIQELVKKQAQLLEEVKFFKNLSIRLMI